MDDPGGVSAAGEGDLVEVTGPNGAHPVYVARHWLTTTVGDGTPVQVAPCHPVTGALLDDTGRGPNAPAPTVDDDHDQGLDVTGVSDRSAPGARAERAGPYRPPKRMTARVKTRDRRCRFPGCTIAAVFCDLDHVTPWPHGPTHDTNLLALCRRHHRIKQRHRWHLTLTPDGTATWTDPTGRVRTTHPADALHTTVLPAVTSAAPAAPTSTSRARTVLPDAPHSALEFHLEHHTAPPPGHPPRPVTTWRDHQGPHRVEVLPVQGVIHLTEHWPCRRTRHRPRPHDHDPPPF